MPDSRNDSFQLALARLRERLREGDLPPGARIAATEVAGALRLSATPVREALARLAGEGLIEDRRGQGYFVRSLTALDIADLYRLSLSCLALPLDAHRGPRRVEPVAIEVAAPEADPIRRVERLFAVWMRQAGGRALATFHHRLTIQLGPVRRLEPRIFADLEAEASDLTAPAEPAAWLRAVRRFHDRRIAAADQLLRLLESQGRPSEV